MYRLALLLSTAAITLATPRASSAQNEPLPATTPTPVGTVALVNGQWFDGRAFVPRTVYSVAGRFTSKKPARVDTTLNLAGLFVVPPYGEGHNHNIGLGTEDAERARLRRYMADGVFYVKIQGNVPVDSAHARRLGINRPDGVDVALAQGSITGAGGHPTALVQMLLARGLYPGQSAESLRDFRYFTIDSEEELTAKWSRVLAQRPDFIKTFLLWSDQYDRRRSDTAFVGRRGLDPRLLPRIVARAHAAGLRVSTHAVTAADFHNAVAAGVDEVAHVPQMWGRPLDEIPGTSAPVTQDDAALAARRGIVVVTTAAATASAMPEAHRSAARALAVTNLTRLHTAGVPLVVGSDSPDDTSVGEVEYLRTLGVFDDLALLKMWTEATPRAIYPKRKIGALTDGYEASFLALGGNPLTDFAAIRKVRIRFKQGVLLGSPGEREDALPPRARPN